MKITVLIFPVLMPVLTISQVTNTATLDTTSGVHIQNIAIGAYADVYYGYNFNQAPGNNIPYLVSTHRHNELNINLAYFDFRYQSKKIRARVVPGFGTYMNANYSNEPGTLRNLVEANIGIRLSEKRKFWLDVGVLGSPYTNESAISKDHLMYTRSLAPEYVPYYITGAKITLPVNEKLNFYLYLLNGWQQIQDVNNGKSVGTQLEFRPNPNHLVNWNTYIGDERSITSANNRIRYFTDVYWLFNAGKKVSFTSCAYVGVQEQKDVFKNLSYHPWWQANFIFAYHFTPQFSMAGRLEYFSDPDRVQIAAVDPAMGFNGGSVGLCLNYKVTDNAMVRFDARHFLAGGDQFLNRDGIGVNNMTWITGNMTVWF